MIAIIYVNKKPFLCFKNNRYIKYIIHCSQLIYCNIIFNIRHSIKRKNIYHLSCEITNKLNFSNYFILGMNTEFYNEKKYSIKNNYKKTPGNIKPIWVKNDYGKQITFLIN